jgi:hypothetical protein
MVYFLCGTFRKLNRNKQKIPDTLVSGITFFTLIKTFRLPLPLTYFTQSWPTKLILKAKDGSTGLLIMSGKEAVRDANAIETGQATVPSSATVDTGSTPEDSVKTN